MYPMITDDPGDGPRTAAELCERAHASGPVRLGVVHPCDPSSLRAAVQAHCDGLVEALIVAPQRRIEALAREHGLDLAGIPIDDVPHSHAAAARAVKLAAEGRVEALMKGSLHTDELVSAVLDRGSLLRTARRVSHCFLIFVPDHPHALIVTDAAIHIEPTLDDKADIVRNAIDLAHILGFREPRVAVLAAVETVNSRMRATIDAAALCKMAERRQIVGATIDGPLALDNAISEQAARMKGIVSEVAGRAQILVVPDLESGNILAKQFEYFSAACSAGIALGARVPIVLTSRSDPIAARVASCALAVLVAHRFREHPP
jgi:phosphotransacetylase